MFTTIQARSIGPVTDQSADRLSRRAYLAIREALKTGELKPGQKLILRPLAAKLGLSATPVREALLRLVSEHALGLDGRSSVLVPTLGSAELDEIRELRIDLEGRAAAVAAMRATVAEIDAMDAIQTRFRSAADAHDARATIEQDAAFHLAVRSNAGKPMLLHMADTLQVRLGPLVALAEAGRADPVAEPHPHELMIDAFRARDADAARAAMVQDLETMFQRLAKFLRPVPEYA